MDSADLNCETSVVNYYRDIFPRLHQALREALLVAKLISPQQRSEYLENNYGILIDVSNQSLFSALFAGEYTITDKNKFTFFMLKFNSESNALVISKD